MTFPFSPYFPAIEKAYRDHAARERWESATAFKRDYADPSYVRYGNNYYPRLPITHEERAPGELTPLFDTSRWRLTDGERRDLRIDDDDDLAEWRESRAHKVYSASRGSPAKPVIEDTLSSLDDPEYASWVEVQDHSIFIEKMQFRALVDLGEALELAAAGDASADELASIRRWGTPPDSPRQLDGDVFGFAEGWMKSWRPRTKESSEMPAPERDFDGDRARFEAKKARDDANRIRAEADAKLKDAEEKLKQAEEQRRSNEQWEKNRHRLYATYGNGKTAPQPQARVTPICAADLAGRRAPPRSWIVPGLVPDRNVTNVTGDGATDKSLLVLQLLASVALAADWIGIPMDVCAPTLYLSAEDEFDEIHRRLEDICADQHVDISALTGLHILPYAGLDAILTSFDQRNGAMTKTTVWQDLVEDIEFIQPKVVVLDTLADVFNGNELNRMQARAFVSALRGLALKYDLAVILLSHPSLTGMNDGSGRSGSTGWGNSVRSRLYFGRVFTAVDKNQLFEEDVDLRRLISNKPNYGRKGSEIYVRYDNGVFKRKKIAGGEGEASKGAADAKFLEMLELFESQCRTVNHSPGANYAPKVFEQHVDAGGFKKRAFKDAMDRLLAAKRIAIEDYGPPSKRRSKLVIVRSGDDNSAGDLD